MSFIKKSAIFVKKVGKKLDEAKTRSAERSRLSFARDIEKIKSETTKLKYQNALEKEKRKYAKNKPKKEERSMFGGKRSSMWD